MSKIIILFIPVLISCSVNRANSDQSYGSKIEVHKLACMGSCPAYKFSANPKSAILTVEKNFSLESGTYQASVDANTWEQINLIIYSNELWKAKDSYNSSHFKDLPTTYLILLRNNQMKKIDIYGKVPNNLSSHLEELETIMNSLNWEKIP